MDAPQQVLACQQVGPLRARRSPVRSDTAAGTGPPRRSAPGPRRAADPLAFSVHASYSSLLRGARGSWSSRLAIADTASQELRPLWDGGHGVGGLGQETPELGVVPAEVVSGAVAMLPNAVPQALLLPDEILMREGIEVSVDRRHGIECGPQFPSEQARDSWSRPAKWCMTTTTPTSLLTIAPVPDRFGLRIRRLGVRIFPSALSKSRSGLCACPGMDSCSTSWQDH
jgi:hypothetical protein